jgi:hypothetical protein
VGSFVASITALSVVAMTSLVFVWVTALQPSSKLPLPPVPQTQSLPSAQGAITVVPPAGASASGGDRPASRKTRTPPAPADTVSPAKAPAPGKQEAQQPTAENTAAAVKPAVREHRGRHVGHCIQQLAAEWRAAIAKERAANHREPRSRNVRHRERDAGGYRPSQRTIASARLCARNFT